MIKARIAALFSALVLGVSACQVEDPLGGITGGNASVSTAKSDLCDVKMPAAVDVLAGRGFQPAKIGSLLFGASEANGCPHDAWLAHLEKNYGQTQGGGDLRDIRYDIHSGQRYLWTDPVALAKAVPSCFASGNVYEKCRPVYHPRFGDPKLEEQIMQTATPVCWNDELGRACQYPAAERACVLTAKWKAFCRKGQGMDGCWSFGKADLVSPPPKSVTDRLRLASAKRITTSATPTATAAAKPKSTPKPKGNFCSEETHTL